MKFWNFPPWSTADEIKEDSINLLYGALSDQETGIEKIDNDVYVLYGKEEALLFRPTYIVYRWGIDIYRSWCKLIT